ncbi:SCO1860 family LAETG-anchored protein [Streptomyces sp. JJ66]|uniref:SCO1860 family LAETG-anchored protein n=1 Tax=Streptomyces sp. JJ66 TaxID=2803843 RepID=UPI0027E36064|nr:SCO1860 family LAETG-anchored protein [Streptomyces sp. JJ66]
MKKSVLSLLVAAVLTGPAAAPAHAAGEDEQAGRAGTAAAAVLRAQLDVSLLDDTVQVPLATSWNAVSAPDADTGADRAGGTALTAQLDGVQGGEPFSVLRADVAESRAEVTEDAASAEVTLARAAVHVPGLPLLSLIEAEKVTAKVVCAVDEPTVAEAGALGTVRVLGKRVTLSAAGPTVVTVPGVGEVNLELSQRETATGSAAASALRLAVTVNPLELNVAKVAGSVTLAEVSCRTPVPGEQSAKPRPEQPEPSREPAPQGEEPQGEPGARVTRTQDEPQDEPHLAATGARSDTPYLLGGAAGLIGVGGALFLLRRRRQS